MVIKIDIYRMVKEQRRQCRQGEKILWLASAHALNQALRHPLVMLQVQITNE